MYKSEAMARALADPRNLRPLKMGGQAVETERKRFELRQCLSATPKGVTAHWTNGGYYAVDPKTGIESLKGNARYYGKRSGPSGRRGGRGARSQEIGERHAQQSLEPRIDPYW